MPRELDGVIDWNASERGEGVAMTMRLLRFDASKDDASQWSISLRRDYRERVHGVHVRRGMRCYIWIWRLAK